MASESPTISIKLLIDQERNKVILAEAGNSFVDTLRSILLFPLGSIARLFGKHQIPEPGCLINLYNSVENLNTNPFPTHACKQMLLYPRTIHENKLEKMKLDMGVIQPTKVFLCENFKCWEKLDTVFSNYKTAKCYCGKLMNRDACEREIDAIKDEIKGVSMFFITDDLGVMKGLPGDFILFLHKLGIKNFHQIKEVLEMDSYETALTDAFLRKQGILSGEMEKTAENDVKTSVRIMLRKSDRKILCAETNEDFVDLPFSFLTIPCDSVLELLQGSNLTIGSISKLLQDLNTIFSITEPKNSQKYVLPPFYSCPKEFRNDLVIKSLSSVSIISLLKELDIPLDDVELQVISIGQAEALALLKACLCSSSPFSVFMNYIVKTPKLEPLQ